MKGFWGWRVQNLVTFQTEKFINSTSFVATQLSKAPESGNVIFQAFNKQLLSSLFVVESPWEIGNAESGSLPVLPWQVETSEASELPLLVPDHALLCLCSRGASLLPVVARAVPEAVNLADPADLSLSWWGAFVLQFILVSADVWADLHGSCWSWASTLE